MHPAFIAIVFSAFALAKQQRRADCTRTYTVAEGDYCDKISAAQKVSTYQLMAINNDKINDACSNLIVGQELCLGTAAADCKETYTVQAGDFCDKILQANAGLNSTMLYANNPQINEVCSNLYIDEVLCVSTSLSVPDVPAGWTMPGMTLDNGYTDSSDLPNGDVPNNAVVDDEKQEPTVASTTAPAASQSSAPKAQAQQKQQPEDNANDDTGDDDEDCEDE